MSTIYRTIEGDMLDAICRTVLGSEAHVPAVLAANPHLADLGVACPAGVLIVLPDVAAPVEAGQIRLWGRTGTPVAAAPAPAIARPEAWSPEIILAEDGLTPILDDALIPLVGVPPLMADDGRTPITDDQLVPVVAA